MLGKEHPEAAVVRRIEEDKGKHTKSSIDGMILKGKKFRRLASVKTAPLIDDFFQPDADNQLDYGDTICYPGTTETYMKSASKWGTYKGKDCPVNTYPSPDGDRWDVDKMKEYTIWKWRNNMKGEEDCPLNPAYIQMKSLLALSNKPDVNGEADILIAHQPGEGKTVNAILLAEMKRNNYIKNNLEAYNAMTNKWEFCRILVTAPKSQILIQWQNTVCKWGFDPLHWIFQTQNCFYDSQALNQYVNWNDIDQETKNLYRDIWVDMSKPQPLNKMQDALNAYKKDAKIEIENQKNPVALKDVLNRIRKKGKVYYIRNMITGKYINLNYKPYSDHKNRFFITWKPKKSGYKVTPFSEAGDLKDKFLSGEKRAESFLCIAKKNGSQEILIILHGGENGEIDPRLSLYITNVINVTRNSIYPIEGKKNIDSVFLSNYKSPIIQTRLNKCKYIIDIISLLTETKNNVGYAAVDKFMTLSHGKHLVQHRYKAEPKTILIIDECHQSLSYRKKRDTDGKFTFQPRTAAFFKYGATTIANILVSATPMLSQNPFNQLRTIAKFLKRETKFYGLGVSKGKINQDGEFEPYELENECPNRSNDPLGNTIFEEQIARQQVKYNEVIDAFRGKITKVSYTNEEDFNKDMEEQGIVTYRIDKEGQRNCKLIPEKKQYIGDSLYTIYRYDNTAKKYKKHDKKISLIERIMSQYLYNNNSYIGKDFWSESKNGLLQADRIKIAKQALRSLYIFRSSAFENPFPTKLAIGDNGYTTFERDIVRKYLTEQRGHIDDLDRRIIPDMLTIETTAKPCDFVFHKALSMELQNNYSHVDGFYPVIVTILNDTHPDKPPEESSSSKTLELLQRMAFSVTDKWIVILVIPSNLKQYEASQYVESALKQVYLGRYNAKYPTRGDIQMTYQTYDQYMEKNRGIFELDRMNRGRLSKLARYLDTDRERPIVKWKRLRERGEQNKDFMDKIISIPGILSSRIERIVLRIEECVANNKNVLVFNNSIEILKAIEFGLKARNNRRIHLQNLYRQKGECEVKNWINGQKEKIYKKWEQWSPEFRKREKKHLDNKCQITDEEKEDYEENEPRFIDSSPDRIPPSMNRYTFKKLMEQNLTDILTQDIPLKEKFEYIAIINESSRAEVMYKLKTPSYRSNDGYWETDDGTRYKAGTKEGSAVPKTKNEYISFKLVEYKNKNRRSAQMKKIVSDVTKILSGTDTEITEMQLMKGYRFYFQSIQTYVNKDLTVLIDITSIFIENNIKKTIRGTISEDKLVSDVTALQKKITQMDSISEPLIKDALVDFKSFVEYVFYTKMKDPAIITAWSERLRGRLKIDLKRMEDVSIPEKQDWNKLKKSLKTQKSYYDIKDSEIVSKNDRKEFKEVAFEVDPKLDIPQKLSKNEMIDLATYLYNIHNVEKIQEIKWAIGWMQFPPNKQQWYKFLYLSPADKKKLYNTVFDDLKARAEKAKAEKAKEADKENKKKTKKAKSAPKPTVKMQPSGRILRQMYDMMKDPPIYKYLVDQYEPRLINLFIRKYERLIKLSKKNDFKFTTHKQIIDFLTELRDNIEKTNHPIEINGWKFLNTCTHLARYYSNKKSDVEEDNEYRKPKLKQTSAYLVFVDEYRKKRKPKKVKLDEISKAWGETNDQDKVPYEKKYEKLKAKYEKDLAKWNEIINKYIADDNDIEETKTDEVQVEEKVPENTPTNKRNNVPGRLRKSPKWEDLMNEFLRPHPLNSTEARRAAYKYNETKIDINVTERLFSCLRQTINSITCPKVINRIKSQQKNKVTFSFLTGQHTRRDDDRQLYKLAFECGMIDCLLMNQACITGIDFDSTRESECIVATCERLPGTQDQFVGRLIRRNSHEHCPKEFRRVSFQTFEETINENDDRYKVEKYHLVPSESEGGLFNMKDTVQTQMRRKENDERSMRSSSSMSMRRGVVHSLGMTSAKKGRKRRPKDEAWTPSGSDSSSSDESDGEVEKPADLRDVLKNRQDIKKGDFERLVNSIVMRLGWSPFPWHHVRYYEKHHMQDEKDVIPDDVLDKYIKLKQAVRQQYDKSVTDQSITDEKIRQKILSDYNIRRNRFKMLKQTPMNIGGNTQIVDASAKVIVDNIQDMIRHKFRGKRHVYYNITVVPVYRNHAFYSAFDLLESGMKYEYGPRLWEASKAHDELDQGGCQMNMKWACYVCNFESPDTTCVKCGATRLDEYYKMEPFYLDRTLQITKQNRNTDERRKQVFTHNRMVLNQTNLDLSMQSIEHSGKMRKDMEVEISCDDGNLRYYQRIQNKTSYEFKKIDSAIDVIYKGSRKPDSNKSDWVKVETGRDDNNYESDRESIQSEYED